LVTCSVWKMPVAVRKHYIGYQLKTGRPRITWRYTIMDISQMNATWDEICRTATDRRVGLDHAQVVSAQAVVPAAGDRASRFRANGRRRRHACQRARSTGVELKRKQNVFDPVNGWSLRPMFRRQPITQIILLAKVINIHAQYHAY